MYSFVDIENFMDVYVSVLWTILYNYTHTNARAQWKPYYRIKYKLNQSYYDQTLNRWLSQVIIKQWSSGANISPVPESEMNYGSERIIALISWRWTLGQDLTFADWFLSRLLSPVNNQLVFIPVDKCLPNNYVILSKLHA